MMLLFYTILCWLISSPAYAEPISLAIAGAVGLSATAAAAAAPYITFALTAVAGMGISLGLGALQKAMAPKPKAGEPLTGIETSVQIGGDVARQIVTGKCGIKGHLVYHNTYGANNDYYQQVFVLSDWISEGLDAVWIDGLRYTLNVATSSGAFTEYQTSEMGPTMLRFRFYDGTQTAADSELVSNSNPVGKWGNAAKLTGLAYVVVHMEYVKDHILYQSGIPKFTFEMKGARLFDPRLSAETGGSGSQTWSDPSTWTYSDNPAIIAYNYQRGFFKADQLIIGMNVPVDDLLHDTYFAAANICDESVSLDAGGTEPRYRCATILTSDDSVSHGQHLDAILSTMAGYLYDYSGHYYLQAGAGYASAATILDSELVLDAPVTYSGKRSRAELFNRVHGQFLDASEEFQPQSYTPQISASGVAEDYEELGRSLDLMSVPSQYQAERIAQIRLRESRRQATASITLGFHRQNLQAGDWITWASDRYGTKTWRIQTRSWDAIRRTVTLELAQIDSNVFSWSTADEGGAVAVAGNISSAVLATTVSTFAVQATTVEDGAGNVWPALRFTWAPTTDPTIDSVVIQYRQTADHTTVSSVSDFSPSDGSYTVTNNVFGGINYEARATITTTPPRVTTWTNWVAITTAETAINIADFVDEQPDIPQGLVVTSSLIVLDTGEVTTLVTADWTSVSNPNFGFYDVEIKEGSGGFIGFQTSTSIYQWRGIKPGTVITVRVRARSNLGNLSGFSLEVTHTVVSSTVPPSGTIGPVADAAFQSTFLSWTNPADKDLRETEVWEATVNNRASAVLVARIVAPGNTAHFTGKTPGTTYYYWVRSVNTSGLAAVNFTPASATAGIAITTASLAMTDFGTGLKPVQIVSDLTSITSPTEGMQAFLTTDKKLYRYTGSAWTKAVDGGDLIANTVTAGAIASGAIITEHLAVGSYAANLIPNGGFEDSLVPWRSFAAGGGGVATRVTGTSQAGVASVRLDRGSSSGGQNFIDLPASHYIPVEGSAIYELSAWALGSSSSAGFYVNKALISSVSQISNAAVSTTWTRYSSQVTAPANARFVNVAPYNYQSAGAQYIYVDELSFRRGLGATIIQDGAITTPKMTANSILGDRIQTNTLNADRIQASTVLSNTVMVTGGNSLGLINQRAADPATVVNSQITQIEPGKILIQGATSLSNWRFGGDNTKIDGGNIAANTIAANKIEVGSRGVSVQGVQFYIERNVSGALTTRVGWTAGTVFYIDDNGTPTYQNIVEVSGFETFGAWHYFTWVKGSSSITATSNHLTAFGPDRIMMATYDGTVGLNANYGNTVIDGDRISTNSLHANRIQANTITANHLASSTLITQTAQIGDLTVSNLKIQDGAVSTMAVALAVSNTGTFTNPVSLRGGSRVQLVYYAFPCTATAANVGFMNMIARTYDVYVLGGYYQGQQACYDVCVGAAAGPTFWWQPSPLYWAIEWNPPFSTTWQFQIIPNHSFYMQYGIIVTELDK
jgi:hypothetical protein